MSEIVTQPLWLREGVRGVRQKALPQAEAQSEPTGKTEKPFPQEKFFSVELP